MKRTRDALVVWTLNGNGAVFNLNGNGSRDGVSEFTLWALNGDNIAVKLDLNTCRDGNWELTNTRHCLTPSLPDVGEDFPTYALVLGLTVSEQT